MDLGDEVHCHKQVLQALHLLARKRIMAMQACGQLLGEGQFALVDPMQELAEQRGKVRQLIAYPLKQHVQGFSSACGRGLACIALQTRAEARKPPGVDVLEQDVALGFETLVYRMGRRESHAHAFDGETRGYNTADQGRQH